VWLSTSDGSRQLRVTESGGYSDVSQADDGTMVALNGVRLHRLTPQGRVLADFDTPVSDLVGGNPHVSGGDITRATGASSRS